MSGMMNQSDMQYYPVPQTGYTPLDNQPKQSKVPPKNNIHKTSVKKVEQKTQWVPIAKPRSHAIPILSPDDPDQGQINDNTTKEESVPLQSEGLTQDGNG